MKFGIKYVALFSSIYAFDVQAQVVVGHNVGWGIQGVPLSPALTLLISLVLGVAAYAFLKRRQGLVAAALLLAGTAGAIGYNLDSYAVPYAYLITTPAGTQYVSCQSGGLLATDQTNGVLLNTIEPVYGQQSASVKPALKSVASKFTTLQPSNGYPNCSPGLTITPTIPCYLVGCNS